MIRFLSRVPARELRGTVLLRLDFNTEDNWRMVAVLPTIRFLLKRAAKIVVVSHRGRPAAIKILAGKPKMFDKSLSLKKDAAWLGRLLGKRVRFVPHFDFARIKKEIDVAPRGSVFVLENLRFLKGEVDNDPKFAKQLAGLADLYVNDAFAVSHRANASVSAVTKFLPSYAGFELGNEIKFLGGAMARPRHPLVFILGGAKAADKLGVIKYFKNKADWFLLCGGPANTILHLKGTNVKKSVRDRDPKDLKKLRQIVNYPNVVLPSDFIWYKDAIVDLGSKTAKEFAEKISLGRTIIWSGPAGLIEKKPYDKGTLAVVRAMTKNRRSFSLAGGGETVMFLKKHKLDKKFSFISTGGGAMLDFLAGKKLPGIAALARTRASLARLAVARAKRAKGGRL